MGARHLGVRSMKLLRAFLVLLVALDFLDPAHGLIDAESAAAQSSQPPIPLLRGPLDPGAMQGTLNLIIQEINGILVPLIPGSPVTPVNFLSLTPGATGTPAVLTLQPGADANASIAIQPNGNGNVILMGQSNMGVVQFGNQASFVSAPGLSPYPGGVPGAAALQGVKNTVQGVLLVKDWLGVTRGVPAY